MTDKWDSTEKSNHPDKEPVFSDYFRRNIEEDTKNGMILSARRRVGLGDEFFYNNGQECANFKYNSKIKESKTQTTTGYRPNTKCTWVEAISVYKNLVEETNRDKQLAVLQKGPFQLSPRYDHLHVPSLQWSKMNRAQSQRHLAKLNISQKNGNELVGDPDCQGEGSAKGSNTANVCDVIRIVALEGINFSENNNSAPKAKLAVRSGIRS